MRDPKRVSPTAHYTGYVWVRRGLSDQRLATWQGRALFHAVQPFVRLASPLVHGFTLEKLLLMRHAILDHLLTEAIESGRVGQVVEVASGLSPRGFRFVQRYPALRYVEADLPGMARRKSRALADAGLLADRHRVVAVDALADSGPLCLERVLPGLLDSGKGTAVVTEGLVNYFDLPTMKAVWARLAAVLRRYPAGVYLTDLHLGGETAGLPVALAFSRLLGIFARGAVHLHFADAGEGQTAFREAGFETTTLHRPSDLRAHVTLPDVRLPDILRIVEARVG